MSSFGSLCKKHRADRGLYLFDQAAAIGLSVAYISAIEVGKRSVPGDYVEKLAKWLSLSHEETSELHNAAPQATNVIKFRPKDNARAKLAYNLSRRLNELSIEEIKALKTALKGNDYAEW